MEGGAFAHGERAGRNAIMNKGDEAAHAATANEPPASQTHRQGSAAIGVSAHILPSSATMVGVCMTVLSIAKLAPGGALGIVIDELLAFDSIVFLVSAILSFVSLRRVERAARLESQAEVVFLWGLGLLVATAVIIAFAIA